MALSLLLQEPARSYRGNPNDDPRLIQQRLIHEHDAKIPASGKLVVTFMPKFKRPPSCSISNKTHPKHSIVPEETDSVDHLILKGHAGDTIHYNCYGIIAGGKEED